MTKKFGKGNNWLLPAALLVYSVFALTYSLCAAGQPQVRQLQVRQLQVRQLQVRQPQVDDGPEGWIWYNERPDEPEIAEQPAAGQPAASQPTAGLPTAGSEDSFAKRAAAARAANDRDRQHFEDAVQIALAQPTVENIVYAQLVQKQTIDRSEEFGRRWVTAPLLRPELLEGTLHKDSSYQYEQEKKAVEADNLKLRGIADEWGLLFYHLPGCRHCPRMVGPLRQLQEETGIQILAVSDEGQDFGGFAGVQSNKLIEEANSEGAAPAVFLVHRSGRAIYTVNIGVTDLHNLRRNIVLLIAAHEQGGQNAQQNS